VQPHAFTLAQLTKPSERGLPAAKELLASMNRLRAILQHRWVRAVFSAIAYVFRQPWVRALIALIGVVAIGVHYNADGAFFRWHTHRDMLRQISVYGILACGMTVVIITGGIDLSVGSVLALSAVVFSKLTMHFGWPAAAALVATIAAGAACGATSGALVAKFRIQPFIATLAMMVFARGLAKTVAGGQKVTPSLTTGDYTVPAIFDMINSKVLGNNVAVVTIIFIVCLLVSWFILSKLLWGRYIYAIGSNEEAAHLVGVSVARVKLLAYALSGFFSGIAGICQASQELQGDPEAGAGYELSAIAIVVIGGTSLNGGRGSMWLTLIGAMTIGYLEKILSINAVPEASRLMLTGLIIVVAVIFQKARR
jgi:ribose transport system permease protein